MVVEDDRRRSVIVQRETEDVARGHRCRGESADEDLPFADDAAAYIEVERAERLLNAVAVVRHQPLRRVLRLPDRLRRGEGECCDASSKLECCTDASNAARAEAAD